MSSCRFRTVLRTRVLQANGSHRIMDKSLVGEPKKDYNHANINDDFARKIVFETSSSEGDDGRSLSHLKNYCF